MHTKNKITSLGFTLLELLFVVAIASVLATVGLSMVRHNAQQAKIDKAVMQIQQLLQAASAYYTDFNCWPPSAGDPPSSACLNPNPPDFVSNYVPVGGTTSPWGDTYSWGVSGKVFEVRVNTLDNVAAQRIAAKLPNAQAGIGGGCTTENCVYAQTTVPVQASGLQVFLVATGNLVFDGPWTNDLVNPLYVNSEVRDISFRCPQGYNPILRLLPAGEVRPDTNPPEGDSPPLPVGTQYVYSLDSYAADVESHIVMMSVYHIRVRASSRICDPVWNLVYLDPTFTCTRYVPYTRVNLSYQVFCCSNSNVCHNDVTGGI